jgi:hypothetical protein
VPERRFVVDVPNVAMARRSGLVETIGMNEAALGAGLWGLNPRLGAERWIRAAAVPRAAAEGVPHVRLSA